MRDAINLLGKSIEIDNTIYEITNVNFLPGTNNFYAELESDDGFLNMSLKDLSSHIDEQISYKNGNYRKKRFDS
jgi:hypothetical protein